MLGPDDDVAALARPDTLAARIRLAAGVPDLPVHLVRQSTFTSGAMLAGTFASGRVFLAGDAAHRVTPRGGNGLAMAVRDRARDRLAAGLGPARLGAALFSETYEEEVRPLAARTWRERPTPRVAATPC